MVVRHKGVVVADLPAKSLTDEAPVYDQPTREPVYLVKAREWKVEPFRSLFLKGWRVLCLVYSNIPPSHPKDGYGSNMITW